MRGTLTLESMVTRSYMSRREAEQQSFNLLATVLIPVVAMLLQEERAGVEIRIAPDEVAELRAEA